MADDVIVIQHGKKIGWLNGHGPPAANTAFADVYSTDLVEPANADTAIGANLDTFVDVVEPAGGSLTADTTAYGADNSSAWPTADTVSLSGAFELSDANIIAVAVLVEAADATDALDAEVISGIAAIWAEIVEPVRLGVNADTTLYTADNAIWPTADGGVLDGAQDYFDAEVIAESLPGEPGGGLPRPLRRRLVEGFGYGVLPQLEGEAHGVVILPGAGVGALPRLGGSSEGAAAGVAGRSAAQLVLRAAAIGDCGQVGKADAVLKGFAALSRGAAVAQGSGSGAIVKFEAAATGQHDDDEAAVIAFLLAA